MITVAHLSPETLDYVASRLGVDGGEMTLYCPMLESQFSSLRRRLGLDVLTDVAREWIAC